MAQCLRDVPGGELVKAEHDVSSSLNVLCVGGISLNYAVIARTAKLALDHRLNDTRMRRFIIDLHGLWDDVKSAHPAEKQA